MTKESNKPKNAPKAKSYPHRQRAGRGQGRSSAVAAGPTSALNTPRHLPWPSSIRQESPFVGAVERCSELEGQLKVTDATRQVLQLELGEAKRIRDLEQRKIDSSLAAANPGAQPSAEPFAAPKSYRIDEGQHKEGDGGKEEKGKEDDVEGSEGL